ncbi:MAG: STAS domain-containing protein [Anaerovoracaceae bacterium]
MEITRNLNGDSLELKVSGRLDTTTAPALEAEIKNSIEGLKSLVFDFAGLDYISSAGLRVLLSAQKSMNKQGTMKLVNVNEVVMEVFEITGFVDVLTIE